MDLKGMVALVTGGNGGLGQRMCHALAHEGAHVAVMYARNRDQAESVASELTSRYKINAQAFACDADRTHSPTSESRHAAGIKVQRIGDPALTFNKH